MKRNTVYAASMIGTLLFTVIAAVIVVTDQPLALLGIALAAMVLCAYLAGSTS